MISDYAFKMTVSFASIPYVGYYIHSRGRQFKLVGMKRIGRNIGVTYLKPSERFLKHMDKQLSYDALDTRRRRAKTYDVERVLVKDIQPELDELEQELVLRLI